MNSRNLSIAVTFPTGRYHGQEWPPSPARLYQALVAGVMTCGYRKYSTMVEPALRWLEKQAPPSIRACDYEDGTHYRIAVPNNDMDVIAREWVSGRSADPGKLKTMKNVRAKRLQPNGPHVEYVWQVPAEEAEAMKDSLRIAAHCLHTLGWGVDMAYADMDSQAELGRVYAPAVSGDSLAVPMDGTLDDLYGTYERFTKRTAGKGVDTHTHPSLLSMQPYRRVGDEIRPAARFILTQPDSDAVKAIAWEDSMVVAGWLRHAAAERLSSEYDDKFVQEYVQGHTSENDKARRLSYVPVPSIHGRFGDGSVRRAMIVEPPNSVGEVTHMLELKLSGCVLFDSHGQAACCLAPADSEDWTFAQYVPQSERKVWRTVTPVVLHGFNSDRRGTLSLAKTERLLLRSFAMSGYGEDMIEGFAFQGAPWWPGTKHASAIQVPDHLRRYPRTHVEVRFRRGVRGPVLAGIGRHYGIGLFATTGEG